MSISILIVDDHRSYARSLALALTGLGYHAEFANDPDGALGAVRKRQFDVLIMDYDMPEINGDALAQKLDEIQAIDQKILISGYDLSKRKEIYKFDHVMSKPLDMNALEHELKIYNNEYIKD